MSATHPDLASAQADEMRRLRDRLIEAEEIIRALRAGEADALVVSGANGPRIYTLEGADHSYRVLVETMNEGAATLQGAGIVLYANARLAEMLGVSLAEIIGQPFARFVVPADQPAFASLLAAGLADRSSGALTVGGAAGGTRPVQLSLRALYDESAATVCMIVTDMSAARAASDQIRSALAEKELLLREVHHRVKNNLQIITSLLRLQARNANSRHISDALVDSQNRIRVMSLVHEQLYRSSVLAAVNIGDYLSSLGSSVFRSYTERAGVVRLECHVATTMALDPDLAIPLGLITTELIMNSIKHAFPNGRGGLIRLHAAAADGELRLAIADDGVGFAPGARQSNSLGLELVTSLARQIGAQIQIDHTGGTRVELRVRRAAPGAAGLPQAS